MGQADAVEPPEVVLDHVDGVRTIRPAETRDGDVTAALSFRVGVADEPVVMRGVTHLVEHLSLTTYTSERIHWNGWVDLTRTCFFAHGPADEVAGFFRHLTRTLSDLPEQRVAHERRVLQVEAQSKEPSVFDGVLAMRYGLQGPGRSVVPEWGLEWLDAQHLRDWVNEWFTSGNAALWSTAPLPGLELTLPNGRPRLPGLPSPRLRLPVVQGRDLPTVLLSSVADRTTATATAVRMLERRMRQRLRHDEGVSYAAQASYLPVSATDAIVAVSADTHAAHTADAATGFVGVLRDLSERGVTVEELDEDRRATIAAMRQEGAELGWLDRVAIACLYGEPDPLGTDFLGELEELRPDAVAGATSAIAQQALLVVPEGTEDHVGPPFQRYARDNPRPVKGEAVRWRYAPAFDPFRLEYGPDGITQWDETGLATTVRFDRCEGVVAWNDGSRLLYGTDGFLLCLDSQEWRGYDRVRAVIDDRAPKPVARVDRGMERDPDWAHQARRWGLKRFVRAQLLFVVIVLLVAVSVIGITVTGAWSEAPTRLPRIVLFATIGTIVAIARNRRDLRTRNGWSTPS